MLKDLHGTTDVNKEPLFLRTQHFDFYMALISLQRYLHHDSSQSCPTQKGEVEEPANRTDYTHNAQLTKFR